jgi:hypothetical protein
MIRTTWLTGAQSPLSYDVTCSRAHIKAALAPHCAALTLVIPTIMADSWRDDIGLKACSPVFFPVVSAHNQIVTRS